MSEPDSAATPRALIDLGELRAETTTLRHRFTQRPDRPGVMRYDHAPAICELCALVEAVEAAQEVAEVFDCRCDKAYTGRGLHGPYCEYEDGDRLRAALEPFAAPGTGASESGQS